LTSEQRSDISNAIWLCATHADLIDRDEVTYTGDVLRAMKRSHEAKCAARQRNAGLPGGPTADLIAIGPDIVFVGEFLGVDGSTWTIHLQNFVEGDLHTLLRYIERYRQTAAVDRYILVNSLGDGGVLSDPPSMTTDRTAGYTVRCPVYQSADRIRATDLPTDFALSENHDLMVKSVQSLSSPASRRYPRRSRRACRIKRAKVRSTRNRSSGGHWTQPRGCDANRPENRGRAD
jgi:hypothetical protein